MTTPYRDEPFSLFTSDLYLSPLYLFILISEPSEPFNTIMCIIWIEHYAIIGWLK